MNIVVTLGGLVVVVSGMAAASAVRWLRRLDHRCVVATRAGACGRCADVVAGRGLGGHVICACGASSEHLAGLELLQWRADHLGEPLGGHPRAATPASHVHRATEGPAALGLGEEAEAARQVALMEELGEVERRAVAKARRNPDPITAQLLREAGVEAAPQGEPAVPQEVSAQASPEVRPSRGPVGREADAG